MTDDPFAAPESEFDNMIRDRTRKNLYSMAAGAIFLSFFQFCCNPCFVTSIAAAAASLNAIRQPRWLEISLEEDYPADAGMVARVCGAIGLLLTGVWFLFQLLYIFLNIALLSSGEF